MKYDIVMCFHDFYEGRLDLYQIKFGVITLLPKGADADTTQKFKPICLLAASVLQDVP